MDYCLNTSNNDKTGETPMIPELNGDFLQWLRGFYYVAKTGSVRKAAELMHRNPSTISYQLKSLEEELGTVLFDRYKKSLIITGEGKKLLGWTISTFETLQSMRSAVGSADGILQGNITFGATLPVVVMAAPVIASFLKEHPAVNVRIERCLNIGVVKGVKESRYDFGLTGLATPPKLDKFDIFLKARPLLVMRKDNTWNLPLPQSTTGWRSGVCPIAIFTGNTPDFPFSDISTFKFEPAFLKAKDDDEHTTGAGGANLPALPSERSPFA